MREPALLRLLQPDVYSLKCHALVQKYDIYPKTFLIFSNKFLKNFKLKNVCLNIFTHLKV